jgi:hypothetical protein
MSIFTKRTWMIPVLALCIAIPGIGYAWSNYTYLGPNATLGPRPQLGETVGHRDRLYNRVYRPTGKLFRLAYRNANFGNVKDWFNSANNPFVVATTTTATPTARTTPGSTCLR